MRLRNKYALSLLSLGIMAAGCGDDGGTTGGTGGMGGTGGTGGTGGVPAGSGSATLTIGEDTWDFDSFACAFGYDGTQSQVFSFSGSVIQDDSNGVRVQLSVDIMDDSGKERFEGEGVVYDVNLDDIENFENPSVSWSARGPADEIVVMINGDQVTANGVFDDGLTDLVVEQVPGTLTATCGAQSIR
ncbi:MAG: hypothetical protein PVI24_11800 [Myxococcales bacterium]|jgi:hypothetical protein